MKKKMTKKERLSMIKREMVIEMNELNQELKRERKIKKIINCCIVLLVLLLIIIIKMFFGTIEINNILGYPPSRSRFYKLTINGEPITTDYNLKHTIPVIPYFININSYHIGSSIIKEDNDGTYFYPNNKEEYIIDIESFTCYKEGLRVECKDENRELKETSDTKYTKLKITRTNNPYEEVYNGKYISNITKYVQEKGIYCVEVTAEYSLVETKINFYFIRK